MPQNADGIIYKKTGPWSYYETMGRGVRARLGSAESGAKQGLYKTCVLCHGIKTAHGPVEHPIPRVNQMTNCSLLFLCFHGCFIAFPMSTQPASESKTSAWYLQGAPERVRCKISCPIWSGALLGAQYQIHDRDPKKMMDDQQTSNLP